MTRLSLPDAVTGPGVVAVMRAARGRDYSVVFDALMHGGVTALELTLSTPGTLEALPVLRRAFPHAYIGVGTVTSADEARAAIAGGAQYLVTPIVNIAVAQTALDARTPLLMGALTPTEALRAWQAGASAIKLFPAAAVGPEYLTQLRGPFREMKVIPSGGIDAEHVGPWIRAGARAVSVGGPLLGDAFSGGSLRMLTERARTLVDAVSIARSHP